MLTCATLWLLLLPAHLAPPATRYLPSTISSMCILASWHLYNGICYSNLTPHTIILLISTLRLSTLDAVLDTVDTVGVVSGGSTLQMVQVNNSNLLF